MVTSKTLKACRCAHPLATFFACCEGEALADVIVLTDCQASLCSFCPAEFLCFSLSFCMLHFCLSATWFALHPMQSVRVTHTRLHIHHCAGRVLLPWQLPRYRWLDDSHVSLELRSFVA